MTEPVAAAGTDADTAASGPVDRLLRVFGDVRAGEGATVLLMCLNVFLLLTAYYILKTAREPLILLAGGAELKSYAAGAQALALIGYVPLYGWLAQKLPRQRFLAAVVLFFVGYRGVAGFARLNMIFVVLAMVGAWLLQREYRRLTDSAPAPAGAASAETVS